MKPDHFQVCTAADLAEADIIVAFLGNHGIKACVKDRNTVGTYTWGTPAVAPRGIEVVTSDEESSRQAKSELENWKGHRAKRTQDESGLTEKVSSTNRNQKRSNNDAKRSVLAICEECGQTAPYPIESRGRVETCSHCGEYIDVPRR